MSTETMDRGVAAQRPRPRARKRLLLVWPLIPALVGFVMWLVYVIAGETSGAEAACGPDLVWSSWSGGGQASAGSATTAAVIGASLWLVSTVAAWVLRRRLGLLFVGFLASDLVGLVVLWNVSTVIWGPRFC